MTWLSPNQSIAVALLFGAAGMVGVFLDTAWHRTIGRDSFFLLPHLFIYGGGLGILLVSVGSIVKATRGGSQEFGGPIIQVGRVRFPFGFSMTALGVLTVIAAAPVDAVWHWMWGKDVLIWSFPHLQAHFGAGLAAVGLLFAISAQAGRGLFRRPGVWKAAMILVFVDLIHRGHFVLAHYTMIPETRTPDFYPFLASLLLPMVLVAAWRSLGPWAPTIASLLFLAVSLTTDVMLRAIEFERYTITPLVVVPAFFLTALALVVSRQLERPWSAVGVGLVFVLVFTGMEAVWMERVVGRPWVWERVLAGLQRSLAAGGLSGYVGWALGGFLRAVRTPGGAASVFGSSARAWRVAVVASLLAVLGLGSTYHPQRFGPPMRVEELNLTPLDSVQYQEAIFWGVLLQDQWGRSPTLTARSEGVIDGSPLPIGPAWCAWSKDGLVADRTRVRFALEVNGTPIDLSRYPIMSLRLRDGRYCVWVGVASRFQRASVNRFLYTVELPSPDGAAGAPHRTVVDLVTVFKDP